MRDDIQNRPIATQFATAVCVDGEWLRAEFDAIIAANFPAADAPSPRCSLPLRAVCAPWLSRPSGHDSLPPTDPFGVASDAARRTGARQRSPPRD